ncbi:MAG: RidA family protein [Deltaproteobacteria bacterium]|nr:MAG: RidA family protein [Deltaproteobacteria bacterium]
MADPIRTPHPTNGSVGVVLPDRPGALAHYPHLRRVGDLVFVSGLSSRRPDQTHEGVLHHPDGTVERDIATQTRACIENLGALLAAEGGGLQHVVDLTTFLVSMRDFDAYNKVYNATFNAATGPTRTTVAVAELPHPDLLIELKAVACIPRASQEPSL